MKRMIKVVAAVFMLGLSLTGVASAQNQTTHNPTWWAKYEYLKAHGATKGAVKTTSVAAGTNVNISNECGPQSETYITLDSTRPRSLAAGSNEIFRDPMRGYFSSDSGANWGALDLPLPAVKGANDGVFGSDPTLAFDTRGNLYYGYIVVYVGNGFGIKGTGMAVARSTDGGQTYPSVNFFSFEPGENHFNDKPMITTDRSLASGFRDNIYIAWDAASGGSTGGGIRVARSSDFGASFSVTRADDPSGPGQSIGAVPFAGPNGELYVAWNDYVANTIAFNRSFDGGATWDRQSTISPKVIPFDIGIPSEFVRRALVYPACDADRSSGPHRGRLYCSWMDLTPGGTTDIFLSFSDSRGSSWSSPQPVTDQLAFAVDRFNHWLSVDPVTGEVNVAFYDTRNDTTGFRYMTDYYFTKSSDGGASWLSPNTRVSDVSSNEHDCNGLFPCPGINYGNQQGDYEGLVSYNGVSHAIWTDSRRQLAPSAGCRTGLAMEEVFTSKIR